MARSYALADLVHPTDVRTFQAEYLEKRSLLCQGRGPGYLSGLFDLGDLEQFLFIVQPQRQPGSLALVKYGEPPAVISPSMTSQALFGAVVGGATLVLNNAHDRWPKLAELVAEVEGALDLRAQVNIYCSPPKARGFSIHTDRHDVIVVQTYGTKRWNLYEAKDELLLEDVELLALTADRSGLATQAAAGGGAAERVWGDPVAEVLMTPGDVLYLPRGTPHAAFAHDEGSLHLTIGLYPVRWHVLLRNLVDAIAAHDVELRRRVPPQTEAGAPPLPDVAELCAWISKSAASPEAKLDVRQLYAGVRASGGGGADPPPGGFLEALFQVEQIDADTRLEFRRRQVQWLWTGQIVVLSDGVATMSGPPAIKTAIEYLVANRRFRVGDLPPELSERSKVVLCRRLIREGFLQRVRG